MDSRGFLFLLIRSSFFHLSVFVFYYLFSVRWLPLYLPSSRPTDLLLPSSGHVGIIKQSRLICVSPWTNAEQFNACMGFTVPFWYVGLVLGHIFSDSTVAYIAYSPHGRRFIWRGGGNNTWKPPECSGVEKSRYFPFFVQRYFPLSFLSYGWDLCSW